MNTGKTFDLDLVALVPGKDDYEILNGLLSTRQKSLGIKEIKYQLVIHTKRDPGCYLEAPGMLQPFQKKAHYALVIFDHEGCGREQESPTDLASDLRGRLDVSGWGDRAEAIVLVPELENWVWSDSPHVASALGWGGNMATLRQWLQTRGLWRQGEQKPHDPKEAVELVLRENRKPRSSAIYGNLARRVGLNRCTDARFDELRNLLKKWFA